MVATSKARRNGAKATPSFPEPNKFTRHAMALAECIRILTDQVFTLRAIAPRSAIDGVAEEQIIIGLDAASVALGEMTRRLAAHSCTDADYDRALARLKQTPIPPTLLVQVIDLRDELLAETSKGR